ncbi:hypothetical protein ABZ499_32980 [Streptomyces sp. NPDC019990]|uniref:hypothetical protein n=1 Tax=Streptomyces sp. NPDC019990 TaxID=3154693 RepID=UPI00340CC40F
MGIRDVARSLRPGKDVALAAQLRQAEEAKARQQQAQAEAERRERARRHKQELARKGSGAKWNH